MNNTWAEETENDIKDIQDQNVEISDVNLWKAFYSHSYTLFFRCEYCDHNFDIDGWFYTFNPVICPKCKTQYSGLFGQIKDSKPTANQDKFTDRYVMETFEGEEFEIRLPPGAYMPNGKANHIALTLFNRIPDKPGKPWGLIDYSDNKPELRLFHEMKQGDRSVNRAPNKPKSFLAGLLSG